MPGPKPKPTALRAIQGGKKTSHRPENGDEPNPPIPSEVPEPPDYLTETEKKAWVIAAADLYPVGLLTALDLNTLARWCAAFAEWTHARKQIEQFGDVIRAPSGYPIHSPYVAIRDKADAKMHKCEDALGMNPATRSRIHVQRGDEADRFERFLSGRKKASS